MKKKKNLKIGYVSQEVFILNNTIKENILFGKKMNKELYLNILKITDLEKDLLSFKLKDLTKIRKWINYFRRTKVFKFLLFYFYKKFKIINLIIF